MSVPSRLTLSLVIALVFGLGILPVAGRSAHEPACPPADRPVVIGHRGASGYLPEHTLASYFVAAEQGADFIEPDLVMTKDGVLVARHENDISASTDVAARPEFADRQTTKTIDGVDVTGWFTEDFTLSELKTLRAIEPVPQFRAANARFDGMFEVPTFDEVLTLAESINELRTSENLQKVDGERLSPIGVYPETKHPTYFASLGLPMEDPLLRALKAHGFGGPDAPAMIQSFEVGNLKRLAALTDIPLVQLMNETGQPYDLTLSGNGTTYEDLARPEGLAEIATYACGVGVPKNLVAPVGSDGSLGAPTAFLDHTHAEGLLTHVFTFRAENYFLPPNLQSSEDPTAYGDLDAEIAAFLEAGIDGLFTDQPDLAVKARDTFLAAR